MNTAPVTTDWEKAAGLKEKPKLKLSDNIAKYAPTWSDIGTGILFIFMGFTAWTGGAIGILVSEGADPTWISLSGIPRWIGMVLILLGADSLVFKGRAIPWLMNKYITPGIEAVLKATLGEERLERLSEKLDKRLNKDKKEERT